MSYFATVLARQHGALGIFSPRTICLGTDKFPEDINGLVVDICHAQGYEVERVITTFKKDQVC